MSDPVPRPVIRLVCSECGPVGEVESEDELDAACEEHWNDHTPGIRFERDAPVPIDPALPPDSGGPTPDEHPDHPDLVDGTP